MFIHNFKYTLKTLFRNKTLIFWTYVFPIALGIMFYLAFSDIENSEKLEVFDIAVVDNEGFKDSEVWTSVFETLSEKDSAEQLFNTKYVDEKEAKKLLDDKKISGYVIIEDGAPVVWVRSDGIEQTVLKYVTEQVSQSSALIKGISENQFKNGEMPEDIEAFYTELYDDVLDMSEETGMIKDSSPEKLSYMMVEFYTLIAMTCLYGGTIGSTALNNALANMSNKGKRMSITPISKGKIVLGSVCAGYVTQLVGLAILFIFTIFTLKVDYGDSLPMIIFLALCGAFAGLTLGIAVAVLCKKSADSKVGIIISITMAGSALAGMMGVGTKYVIDKNVPILNLINPANMITDGFYALYYYDTLDRYFFNIISLLVFSAVMVAISASGLRRQRYDSI